MRFFHLFIFYFVQLLHKKYRTKIQQQKKKQNNKNKGLEEKSK